MSVRPTILVVDDEPQIQRFLRHSLMAAGYEVLSADNARAAIAEAGRAKPDLMVLDLGLPDMDGKSVIGQLRQTSDVPIIVLSARDEEAEKIAALDLGANDFIAKPFAIGEFLARVRVLLRGRRVPVADDDIIRVGRLAIDPAQHRVEIDGEAVKLTPKEFELLAYLAEHPGRVLTHRQILGRIWGPAHVADTPYLRVFIGQLRAKIEAVPAQPALILTEPGVGYRLADPGGG